MAYIEQDTLMHKIKEIHCAECDSYHGVRCRACWVDDALNYIDSEPAADVAPVRHGRWIYRPDNLFQYDSTQECSCCHEKEYLTLCNENYCPNCGAKMDLEE